MGAVTTLAVTIAAAAGAVALYRFVDRKQNELREVFTDPKARTDQKRSAVIDYERDPESGVYKPRD